MDKHNRKLDAISHIDDEIIERQTQKRIALLSTIRRKANRRRLFITIGSMAASLALIATTVMILVTVLTKQVPIYTGMSISDTFPLAQDAVMERVDTPLYATAPDTQQNLPSGDISTRPTPTVDPFEKPLAESFPTAGDKRDIWYTSPGQDVYITVHIENPDSFEILSFTLNGQKYTNYMFEQGSDLENLVLKVNVGSAEGVVDYTIDAIKYVDGKKIKDVRMEGDKTVQIGVYTSKQPDTAVGNESIGFDSISFTVTATDTLDLIAQSEGKMQAVLYDGTRIVSTKDVTPKGNTAVTFDGLSPNTLYEYALIAVYDALDGDGKITHILAQKAFYTRAHVLFDGITVSKSAASFSLQWASGATGHSITALALYKDNTKVRDIAADAMTVTDLLPNTAYRLVANYTYNGTNGSIAMTFTTAPLQYTAKYMLQALNGSDYTVEKSETVTLMPGDTFAPEVLSYTGFTAPEAQTKTASIEDETPVIEYRYTRNTYAMAFLNGSSRQNETMQFGAALPTVERAGHSFLGWFDVNGTRHTTVPAAATVLTARWSGELTAEDLLYTGSNRITITGLKNLALAEISIPAYIGGGKVVGIGEDAFRDCDHLTKITLPATLENVGAGAFAGCSALERVYFDGTLAQWCNIAFFENPEIGYDPDTFLYPLARYASNPIVHTGNLYLTCAPEVNAVSGEVTLPAGALTGSFCFVGAPITALTVPEDATVFPFGLLTNCTSLTAIHFNATAMPDAEINNPYSFMLGAGYESGGISITVGANVTRIPAGGIFGGAKIAAITFAQSSVCTELGDQAFRTVNNPADRSMNECTELILPEGLLRIGHYALQANLLTSLTIPASVIEISPNAFFRMYSLETLYYNCNAALPQTSTGSAFNAMGTRTENGTRVVFGAGVTKAPAGLFNGEYAACKLASVDFAAGSLCTEIEARAFENCTGLVQIALPAGLTTIGDNAFAGCTGLTQIALPAGLTTIGEQAFRGSGITEITLPAGLEHIDTAAFIECAALTNIYFGGTRAQWEAMNISFAGGSTPTVHCADDE